MRGKRTNMETGYLPRKCILVHVYINIYRNTPAFLSIHSMEHTRLTIVVIFGGLEWDF